MTPLAKLQSASFKGFPFLVSGEVEDSHGRKIAIHDYPNSGKRYAQDLGGLPPTYSVDGWIHGDKFLEQTEQFKKVLDSEGLGQLVLPHLGTLDVVAMPYSVDYSHKTIGVVKFTLKFTVSTADEVPAQAPSSISDVYQSGDELRLSMQDKFQQEYKDPTSEDSFLTMANDYRRAVVDTVVDATSAVNVANSKLQKIVRDVQTDLVKLVRDPQELAKKLIYGNKALANGLMATISSLYSETIDNVSELQDFFRKPQASEAMTPTAFGLKWADNGASSSSSGITLWPNDTGNRIEKNNNRVLTVETVRMNGLIFGFEAASNFDYQTSEEILGTISVLETAYADLVLVDDDNLILANDNEFIEQLDNMRSLCYNILDQKLQQVYTVSEYRLYGIHSVFGLAYKLYSEKLETDEDLQEMAESLVDLNPSQNLCAFTDNVSIFEVL